MHMGAKWQKFEVLLPETFRSAKDKLAVGEDLIEYMRRRTEKGLDKEGDRFPGYSKSYKNSLDFAIAGKSPGKVNLTQTGDMLSDIEVLSIKGDRLLIGFERGSLSNDKADGHITGWQGRSKTKREFLGFEGSETKAMKDIIKKHEKELEKDSKTLRALAWLSGKDLKRGKK
jgi:hypothetical protein